MTSPTVIHSVGLPAPRADAIGKVTGGATYTADLRLPGTVWGKVLRSPYPHARIAGIDTSAARQVPGVHAVLTGDDLPPNTRFGRRIVDVPVLAQGIVRFIGEPVAAVAADDEDIAQRALDLIEVEYEELPAIFDALEAIEPGATLLHPDVMNYTGLPAPLERPSNVVTRTVWGTGDVDQGFRQAEWTFDYTFTIPTVHQAYIEPHSCLVRIDEAGRVQVWASNKAPYNLRQQVAACIGLPLERIRINPVTIGGDFGGKGSPMFIPLAYFLAKATARTVRIVLAYAEELTSANPRHPCVAQVRVGANRDGTIVAYQARLVFNSGAYAGFKPAGFLPGAQHGGGAYHVPHCKVEALGVYTNRVPCGHMRGPGEPQSIFAFESAVDRVARDLGLPPLEVRRKNLLRDGETNSLGHRYQDIRAEDTLNAALEAAGWDAPKGKNVGRGVAICERAPGGGETHANVTLHADGSVVLHTSIFEQGSGSYTTLQQVAAEELGLPHDAVRVEVWDTDAVPFDTGVGGSRVTRVATQAGAGAAQQARDLLLQRAAQTLGWPREQLTLAGTRIRRNDTGETHSWADVIAKTGSPVVGGASIKDMGPAPVTGFTAQVAEVEVDPETGAVKLRRIASAHDVGRVVNPMGIRGQIYGGIAQGVGYGMMEELRMDDGRVTTASFADYKIPTMADMPEVRIVLLESESGVGPYHVKGIGENPNAPTAAAIANAVEDAVGVRIDDLPITAEKVYRALRAKRQ
ncbi:MAG: xanthine dehydrogenase family protein molybdopterin-binding subunit [SAR202 cluster bacterium]|nr:xanthine dehydrogenase family protein molybdopterin-binding subunit [SAR202 cluster bacterium]